MAPDSGTESQAMRTSYKKSRTSSRRHLGACINKCSSHRSNSTFPFRPCVFNRWRNQLPLDMPERLHFAFTTNGHRVSDSAATARLRIGVLLKGLLNATKVGCINGKGNVVRCPQDLRDKINVNHPPAHRPNCLVERAVACYLRKILEGPLAHADSNFRQAGSGNWFCCHWSLSTLRRTHPYSLSSPMCPLRLTCPWSRVFLQTLIGNYFHTVKHCRRLSRR